MRGDVVMLIEQVVKGSALTRVVALGSGFFIDAKFTS
jgi:hypothetical protein